MGNWILFGLLGLIWGSSFLLIKIGVGEFGAFPLVATRIGLASLAFIVTLIATRRKLPTDRKTWLSLAFVGFLNTALPFLLITWGEETIDSGLAGVLNSTVPLFSMGIAHVALQDDKIHFGKVVGLIGGFAGIMLLLLRTSEPNHQNSLAGQVAVLLAALCYAISAVYIRRNLRHVESIVTAGTTLTFGAIYTIVATLLFVHPLPDLTAISSNAILAVVVLGFLNTFIAYIISFHLNYAWGASRSTTVTYLMPPVSLILGIIFYHEPFDIRLFLAAGLIIGGVLMANLWKPRKPITASSPAAIPAK
ncbi:MAG: EamA family transporter [Anaerolineae bacterium]|nr:EamA family transporter [Anaerolineae bacterium]